MAEGQRRKRGTGSVYAYGDGRYRAQIRLRDAAGKPQTHTDTFNTEEEAEEWLLRVRNGHHGGARHTLIPEHTADLSRPREIFPGSPATFAEFASIWMQYKYSAVKGPLDPHMKTVSDYETNIRLYMIPKLGTIRMGKLHWDNIQDWMNWLREVPSEMTGRPLSKSAQRRIWVVFKQMMKFATAEQFVPRNPIGAHKGIEMPPQKVLKRAMSKADFYKFQDLIRQRGCDHSNDYCELRWELAITLARRQGEVLGLSYSDITVTSTEQWIEVNNHLIIRPYQHGCLDMNNQPTCNRRYGGHCPRRHSGGPVLVSGTKAGEASAPMVPLTPEIVRIFKRHRSLHQKELTELRNSGKLREGLKEAGVDNLVFTRHHNGNVWTPSDDHQVFKQLLREASITKEYRLHDLRHTSVSYIVESTSNISTAQAIAGHKTILTTQKYVSQDMAALLAGLNASNAALERGRSKSDAKKKKKKAKKKVAVGE